jgi:hypothetical protein
MSLKRTILLCTTMALCGCNLAAKQEPAKEAAAPVREANPAPPAAATPAPAPKPAPAKKAEPAKPKQLVPDGAAPTGWLGTPKKIAKAEEATSGKNAVKLMESDGYVLLEQAVKGVPKNKKLLVSAKIKAAGTKDVALKALYYQGGEEKSQRVQYKGAGDWRVTSFEMTLPQDATPSSFRVQILRGPEADGPVLVDDVAVIVQP